MRAISLLLLSCFLASCSDSGGDPQLDATTAPTATGQTPPMTGACDVPTLNKWVEENMRDYYYFYDRVPTVNLAGFDSPENLIKALRYEASDPFSHVTNKATQQAFFDKGISFGFGMRFVRDAADLMRISLVYDHSPMGRAGARRSDIILGLNDLLLSQISAEKYDELVGTDDAPRMVTWNLRDGVTNELKNITTQMAEYKLKTVVSAQILTLGGFSGKVGYLMFNSFLETSKDELDAAMAAFNQIGITELVLDLRYNGGGRISVAAKLAGLIGGAATDEKLLLKFIFNDKYQDNNFSFNFSAEINSLGLSRVIIITTDQSASSSEIVINGLAPYIEVVTMGDTSTGKPYISTARDNCDKTINAIEAEGFNANNVSVFGGVPATCFTEDDLTRDFGLVLDQEATGNVEQMLLDSLKYIVNGTCRTGPVVVAGRQALEPSGLRADKWFGGAVNDL